MYHSINNYLKKESSTPIISNFQVDRTKLRDKLSFYIDTIVGIDTLGDYKLIIF